jgi:hypothetical protein
MVNRLRRTFPKRPRVYLFNTGESELTQIIAYLWRHRDTNPDLTKVLRLKPEEPAWLTANVGPFEGMPPS